MYGDIFYLKCSAAFKIGHALIAERVQPFPEIIAAHEELLRIGLKVELLFKVIHQAVLHGALDLLERQRRSLNYPVGQRLGLLHQLLPVALVLELKPTQNLQQQAV